MHNLNPDERDLLERIGEKEELRPFFFRKAKGLKWFDSLAERGYFSPTENPRPRPSRDEGYVTVPFWSATEYLVSTSAELHSEENHVYAEKFVDLIREVTRYAIVHEFSNYRTWWQFSKIVQNIPATHFRDEDLVLIDYWLNDPYETSLIAEEIGQKWLTGLLEGHNDHSERLASELLRIVFKLKFQNRELGLSTRTEATLRVRPWSARKVMEHVASKAGKILGLDAVRVFQEQFESILAELKNDKWSSVWRSAIGDHEQNHSLDDVEDIILEGFRDSLLAWIREGTRESYQYVNELLASPYETTRRVAIYAIDQRYPYLSHLVDSVIIKLYFTSNYRHELWHLLRNHYKELSQVQKEQVQLSINSLTEQDENGNIEEGATAYRRAIWLSAVKDIDESLTETYRGYVAIIGGEPEHPDLSSYMTSGAVNHKSPFSIEELLAMDVGELVTQLANYREAYVPRLGRNDPDLEGLLGTLRQVVKGNPLRFHNQLHKFSDSDLSFVYELVEAYGELWSEDAQLPWDEIWAALLEFCLSIVSQDRFWSPPNVPAQSSHFVANAHSIIQGIGRLIEAGTKSDDHAFNEVFLEKAENILLIVLKKESGEVFKPEDDAVAIAINGPRGQCLEAIINLTLRACRLERSRCGNHLTAWAHFQPIYDNELARVGEYEFTTLAANYLPNFLFMSNTWTLANLEKIFDKDEYQKWLCALQGYAYVNTVYADIYRHLKEHGDLLRALDDQNLAKRVGNKVVQHIAIAYINDFENLEEESSLVNHLLVRRVPDELGHLIWFFWSLRKDGDEGIRSKVFALWPRLLKVIDTSGRDGRRLASKLCDWSIFVDEVSAQNRDLLLAVAPFADEDYNSHELLESIARFSEGQPFEAFEIWKKLLEQAKPDFPEEAIRSAFANLARVGPEGVRRARMIVSEYLRGGNERPSQWLEEILGGLRND